MLLHDPLPVEGHRTEGAGETLLVAVLQRLQMSLKLNVKLRQIFDTVVTFSA